MHVQRALITIHDVMPSTMPDVAELTELCGQHGLRPLTLLVVTGHSWPASDLRQLREWQNEGHQLAGHGWLHKCGPIDSWQHRLHSFLLSRDVAEHLSLTGEQIEGLIVRSANWFVEHDFSVPVLYVPPAWALGAVRRERLSTLPYLMIETLSGVLCTRSGRYRSLPLVGYEADNMFRTVSLRAWNGLNRLRARGCGRPLRIAIHPRDGRLRLQRDLRETLRSRLEPLSYAEFCRHSRLSPPRK